MARSIAFERCSNVVGQLNELNHWGLSAEELQGYSEHLTSIGLDITHVPEERLQALISNYHADHRLVAALSDRDDPLHLEHWEAWSKHVVRFVASRLRADGVADVATISYEDLGQEIMSDLWKALPSFRYESRLQTWVFTVAANRIARSFRAANTQKRRPALDIHSLERVAFLEATDHPLDMSIEDVAMAQSFEALLRSILAEHPDARLLAIFHLWLHEDQPLRVIGDHLNLSVPRVHALLNHALTILRSEQRITNWAYQVD